MAIGYANLGSAQRQLGADLVRFGAAAKVFRGHETIIELTCRYMAAPWLILQPDVQYGINPGAGVPNPVTNGKTLTLKDAVLAGMRAAVTF